MVRPFTSVFIPVLELPLSPRFFDVSKQITGQLFVHGGNVLISGIVARLSSGNACVLYFLNILIDTTLGECRLLVKLTFPDHRYHLHQASQSYT